MLRNYRIDNLVCLICSGHRSLEYLMAKWGLLCTQLLDASDILPPSKLSTLSVPIELVEMRTKTWRYTLVFLPCFNSMTDTNHGMGRKKFISMLVSAMLLMQGYCSAFYKFIANEWCDHESLEVHTSVGLLLSFSNTILGQWMGRIDC
jgi:hypothetical protein